MKHRNQALPIEDTLEFWQVRQTLNIEQNLHGQQDTLS